MARRILITILLTSLLAGAETYQLANRAGLPLGRMADGSRAALPYATFTNTATWLTGQLNGSAMTDFSLERIDAVIQSPAAVFNGAGDYVSIPATTIAGDFIYTAKIKFPSDATNGLAIFGGPASSVDWSVILRTINNQQFFARVRNAADDNYTQASGGNFAAKFDGGWHDVTVSYVAATANISITVDALTANSSTWTDGSPSTTKRIAYLGRGSIGGVAPTYSPQSISDAKLVIGGTTFLHYPITEGSGTTIYDVTGNGNHGTATIASSEAQFWGGTQTNSPYFAENGGSKVLRSSGSGLISFGDQSAFDFMTAGTDFSIGCWVNMNAADSFFRAVWGKKDAHGAYTTDSYSLYFGRTTTQPATVIYQGVRNGVMETRVFGSNLTEAWHFIVVSFDTSINQAYGSIDGAPFNMGVHLGSLALSTSDSFCYGYTGSYGVMNGSVGRLVVYDRLLSNAEAATLYGGGVLGDEILDARTSMSYGTTLPDLLGNYDGALSGTVYNTIVPGLADGTDDAAGLGITNPPDLAHNNGGFSLIFGETTNTYANLLTNSVNIATNAAGLITEVWE